MENLNAENIINEIQSLIKALKDCGGWVKRGNGEGWFNHEILADALAIITSQEQRIKELTEENERLAKLSDDLGRDVDVKLKRILELEETYDKELDRLNAEKADVTYFKKQLIADTVRKMQEEINKTLSALCKGDISEIHRIVDQIAKEMLEGAK